MKKKEDNLQGRREKRPLNIEITGLFIAKTARWMEDLFAAPDRLAIV